MSQVLEVQGDLAKSLRDFAHQLQFAVSDKQFVQHVQVDYQVALSGSLAGRHCIPS